MGGSYALSTFPKYHAKPKHQNKKPWLAVATNPLLLRLHSDSIETLFRCRRRVIHYSQKAVCLDG